MKVNVPYAKARRRHILDPTPPKILCGGVSQRETEGEKHFPHNPKRHCGRVSSPCTGLLDVICLARPRDASYTACKQKPPRESSQHLLAVLTNLCMRGFCPGSSLLFPCIDFGLPLLLVFELLFRCIGGSSLTSPCSLSLNPDKHL